MIWLSVRLNKVKNGTTWWWLNKPTKEPFHQPCCEMLISALWVFFHLSGLESVFMIKRPRCLFRGLRAHWSLDELLLIPFPRVSALTQRSLKAVILKTRGSNCTCALTDESECLHLVLFTVTLNHWNYSAESVTRWPIIDLCLVLSVLWSWCLFTVKFTG